MENQFAVSFESYTGSYSFIEEFNSVKEILEWLNKNYWYHRNAYALNLDNGSFYRIYNNSYKKIDADKNLETYEFLLELN